MLSFLIILFTRLYFLTITFCTLLLSLFPTLKNVFLSYGKLSQNNTLPHPLLAKLRDCTVPKTYFTHFYIFAVLWSSYLFYEISIRLFDLQLPSYFILDFALNSTVQEPQQDATSLLLSIVFMLFHVSVRLVEHLFFTNSSEARMHVSHYVVGITYYLFAPLATVAEGLSGIRHGKEFALKDIQTHQYAALLLCVIGSLHQWRCHRIFQQIGKPKPKKENHASSIQGKKSGTAESATGQSKYSIPYGDWFFYVSSPHYFAEIVIYVAISLANGMSNWTANILLLWVNTTLITVGVETHKWYHERFGDAYPAERKAVIPFVI